MYNTIITYYITNNIESRLVYFELISSGSLKLVGYSLDLINGYQGNYLKKDPVASYPNNH